MTDLKIVQPRKSLKVSIEKGTRAYKNGARSRLSKKWVKG